MYISSKVKENTSHYSKKKFYKKNAVILNYPFIK